jgi:site-specific recombinase XerD
LEVRGVLHRQYPDKNTRAAYARAAGAFLHWCEERGLHRLENLQPVHVAAYIEELQGSVAAPTVKQHLACIRMLFDWLVTGQVIGSNPAHSVRGPRHSVSKGATAVISSVEARELLPACLRLALQARSRQEQHRLRPGVELTALNISHVCWHGFQTETPYTP